MILLVDDDPDILEIMQHLLHRHGLVAVTAPDRDTALAFLRDQDGRVDAVVADLTLPGETAGGLAEEIARLFPDVKLVYASGMSRGDAVSAGLVRPDAPYLQKPVTGKMVIGLLQEVLGSAG